MSGPNDNTGQAFEADRDELYGGDAVEDQETDNDDDNESDNESDDESEDLEEPE